MTFLRYAQTNYGPQPVFWSPVGEVLRLSSNKALVAPRIDTAPELNFVRARPLQIPGWDGIRNLFTAGRDYESSAQAALRYETAHLDALRYIELQVANLAEIIRVKNLSAASVAEARQVQERLLRAYGASTLSRPHYFDYVHFGMDTFQRMEAERRYYRDLSAYELQLAHLTAAQKRARDLLNQLLAQEADLLSAIEAANREKLLAQAELERLAAEQAADMARRQAAIKGLHAHEAAVFAEAAALSPPEEAFTAHRKKQNDAKLRFLRKNVAAGFIMDLVMKFYNAEELLDLADVIGRSMKVKATAKDVSWHVRQIYRSDVEFGEAAARLLNLAATEWQVDWQLLYDGLLQEVVLDYLWAAQRRLPFRPVEDNLVFDVERYLRDHANTQNQLERIF